MAEQTAVVIISSSHSYCSRCGQNVVDHGANKKRHVDKSGYEGELGAGCQSVFIARSTDQGGKGAEYGADMGWWRLPFMPFNEVFFGELPWVPQSSS